ncbi:MAG: hypothetical protein J5967_03520, partial [Oscillospiraceae bacterium]|nr:hypothetical protein [Oscillospiraceae bacterium]
MRGSVEQNRQRKDKLVPTAWRENGDNTEYVYVQCARDEVGLQRPSIYFYGLVALYRQYKVTLCDPEPLSYLDVDSSGEPVVRKKKPANVFLGQGHDHDIRYLYQQIAVTATAAEAGGNINGTLTGYYIKPDGTSGKGYFLATSGSIIDLNDALMKELDTYARNNRTGAVITKGSGNVYSMGLMITPVFRRTGVSVQFIQSKDGRFDWQDLLADRSRLESLAAQLDVGRDSYSYDAGTGTVRGLFAMGDTLNLSATPNTEGDHYVAFQHSGYSNPGDTVPASRETRSHDSQMKNWGYLTLSFIRNEMTPLFAREGNRIEVICENGAEDYFYLTPIASAADKGDAFPDRRVLRIDDSFTGDKVTPVSGRVYTLEAVESPGNDGTVRPVFRLHDGTEVKGWAVDLAASSAPGENVITVNWEKYDPAQGRYFSLEGSVNYPSVTVRQSAEPLRNEPARNVSVTAGGRPADYYTAAGKLGSLVSRPSAQSDENGRFTVDGVWAVPGDRISVKVDDNGVTQAEYRVLPAGGPEEERSFQIYEPDHGAKKNVVRTVTEKCMAASLDSDAGDGRYGAVGLPIITGYDWSLLMPENRKSDSGSPIFVSADGKVTALAPGR